MLLQKPSLASWRRYSRDRPHAVLISNQPSSKPGIRRRQSHRLDCKFKRRWPLGCSIQFRRARSYYHGNSRSTDVTYSGCRNRRRSFLFLEFLVHNRIECHAQRTGRSLGRQLGLGSRARRQARSVPNYTQYTVSGLTASSASTPLTFIGRRDPDYDALDNVDLQATNYTSAPELSTLLLIGGALLLLFFTLPGAPKFVCSAN